MTKLQKIIGLAAAFMLMVGLSACTPPINDGGVVMPANIDEFSVTLKDGTQVPCVRLDATYGFDCNWDKAVRSNTPTP